MSEFSGKCDVWDTIVYIGKVTDDYDWSKLEIYQKDVKLDIKSLKDLIKYAPYLICVGSCFNGHCRYVITTESFIDREEREHLTYTLKWAKQYYRKCKRKNQEFIPEEAAKAITIFPSETDIEICRRVKEHPYTNNIKGLSRELQNMYRELWFEAMVNYGYSEEEAMAWIYGN